MKIQFYWKVFTAIMTVLFVSTSCSEDNTGDDNGDKIIVPGIIQIQSKVTETQATVTFTAQDGNAPYYAGLIKKSDYETFEGGGTDEALFAHDLKNIQATADKAGQPIESHLAQTLNKGSFTKTFNDLEEGAEYYAYAYGMTTQATPTSAVTMVSVTTTAATPLFTIEVSDLRHDAATVSVTPRNNEQSYLFDILSEEEYLSYGGTLEGMPDFINYYLEFNSWYQQRPIPEMLAEILSVGKDSDTWGLLYSSTKYYVFAVGMDINGNLTTAITLEPFTTAESTSVTFELSTSNITSTTVTGTAIPSNDNAIYFMDIQPVSTYERFTDDNRFMASIIDAFKEAGMFEARLTSGTKKANFKGLQPDTEYYLYTFGYENNFVTTKLTKTKFKTEKDGGSPTDDFTFEYNMASYQNVEITVHPKNTAAPYIWNIMPKTVYEQMGGNDAAVKAFFEEYITFYMGNYGWDRTEAVARLSDIGQASYAYTNLEASTDYIAWALGVDANGTLTTNSVVSPFTTPKDGVGDATDAYKAWLGTWTLTSTSSALKKKPLTMDITIDQKVVNTSYAIKGWDISSYRNEVTMIGDFKNEELVIKTGQELGTTSKGAIKLISLCSSAGEYGVLFTIFDAISCKLNVDKTTATVTGNTGTLVGGAAFQVETVIQGVFKDGKFAGFFDPDPTSGFTANDHPVGVLTLTKKSGASNSSTNRVSPANLRTIGMAKTPYEVFSANFMSLQVSSMLREKTTAETDSIEAMNVSLKNIDGAVNTESVKSAAFSRRK